MTEKKFFELTDRDMIALIKKGEVRHRLCNVCGCELSVSDAGVFSREGVTTMACTVCTNTKAHYALLSYIVELRKSHDKQEIHHILEERMKETWDDGSIFTVEKWEEQTKGDGVNG